MTQEEAWYFRHNGFHRIARPLPRKLVARLNAVTDEQIATLAGPSCGKPAPPRACPKTCVVCRKS